MRDRELPPATLEGWYALHQLIRLSWPALKALPAGQQRRLGTEFGGILEEWSEPGDGGWSGAYRLVGGGADHLLLHFRPSLEELCRAERRIRASGLGDHLTVVRDYVSVVELGLYGLTVQLAERLEEEGRADDRDDWEQELEKLLEEQRSIPYVDSRLHPTQPDDMPYLSFYPMNKRREAGRNWYTLPLRRRARLMHEHGTVGRRYARRISQVISGSVGLDDWEWAVTLFGRDPLDFKAVVTEMRYDEASAEYAEFGEFFVGIRMEAQEWRDPASW